MLIASASNNQTIAPTSSVKLRRSRRLSSTRGLKQRTTANIPKDSLPCQDLHQKFDPCSVASRNVDEDNTRGRLINWEMNERISLSSGSSIGLAIRPDSMKGIEFSENRKREIESRSKIGECSERNCKGKSSSLSSTKPTLELMNVSGFLSNVDRKHRESFHSIEIDTTDENILKSDSKYEIGIPSHNSATRKQKQQDTLRKDNVDATRRWTKDKSGDSISKRLELIHELNQKILANYEKFQQRSKRAKDTKEQTIKNRVKDRIDPEEHVYTEIKRKNKTTCRTSDRTNQDIKQDISNQETCRKDSSKRDTCRQADTNKSVLSKSHYESIKSRMEKKDISRTTNKPNRRIICENTNFSMTAKENFFYQADEKTQPLKYVKLKNKKGQLSEGSSIFYANEDIPPKEIESIETQDCLENSRLYPESCNLYNNESEDGSLKENAKDNASKIDQSDPRRKAESRTRGDDAVMDEKILESKILKNLDETIDRFDSERTQLTSGESNEEKDSFSTDSIQSGSPSSVKDSKDAVNLLDTFNSSWDSGVGVDVGNGSGWVRIHTGIESSLVYLTLDTTAKDVCRDMLLGDDLSLFVQVNASLRG